MYNTRRNLMPFRQYVSSTVLDQLQTSKVLHIDIVLYQTGDDKLYFEFIALGAGVQPIPTNGHRTFRAEPMGIVEQENIPNLASIGLKRHINSPWARKYAPWLTRAHGDLLALAWGSWPNWIHRRSIKLHYIWSNPRVCDPCEGIDNVWMVTDRGRRFDPDAYEQAILGPATTRKVGRPRSPWSSRERSLLRTLDKLLK